MGKFLSAVLAVAVLATAIVLTCWLLTDADGDDQWVGAKRRGGSCLPIPSIPPPKNPITMTGLPEGIAMDFGYGRGRRVSDSSTATASVPSGGELPGRMSMAFLPLERSDTRSIRRVAAVADQVGSTTTYRIRICIDAAGVAGGSYSGKLLFRSDRVSSETTTAVTARFQNQLVPVMFVFGLPLAALGGIVYTAALMIRRGNPNIDREKGLRSLRGAIFSVNGLFAGITALGASFGVWYASCYTNQTWASDWPQVLVTFVSLAAAAGAAATVPLGLSSKPVEGMKEE